MLHWPSHADSINQVQVKPTAEYFVHGASRRWVLLSEFVDICDVPLFKYAGAGVVPSGLRT